MRNFTIATALAFAIPLLFALAPGNAAEPLKSNGQCWTNTGDTHFEWGDCKQEKKAPKHAAKAHGKSEKKKA